MRIRQILYSRARHFCAHPLVDPSTTKLPSRTEYRQKNRNCAKGKSEDLSPWQMQDKIMYKEIDTQTWKEHNEEHILDFSCGRSGEGKRVVKTLADGARDIERIIHNQCRRVRNDHHSLLIARHRSRRRTAHKVDIPRRTRACVANRQRRCVRTAGSDLCRNGDSAGFLQWNNVRAHISRLARTLDLVHTTALGIEVRVVERVSLSEEDRLRGWVADVSEGHAGPVAPDDLLDRTALQEASIRMQWCLVAVLTILGEALVYGALSQAGEVVRVVCQVRQEGPLLVVVGGTVDEDKV